MEIVKLDTSYQGKKLIFSYETTSYFSVQVQEAPHQMSLVFTKQSFQEPVYKEFEGTLLEPWVEEPHLYGARTGDADDTIVGYLEVSHEQWNNRLRVTNLFIEKHARRKGIGRRLLQQADAVAKTLGARAVVLETQTCNEPAINLYRSHGYRILGCDIAAYSNADVAANEVRLELIKFVV